MEVEDDDDIKEKEASKNEEEIVGELNRWCMEQIMTIESLRKQYLECEDFITLNKTERL